MRIENSHGFSLVELLAVVGIFMVLATISVVAWSSFGPYMALNGAAEGLGDAFELCAHKSLTQKNEFFVLINYRDQLYGSQDNSTFRFPGHSYLIVDDDGWEPRTAGRTRRYNTRTMSGGADQEFRAEWIPDEANYNTRWRSNNLVESREIFKGPLKLGKGVYFQALNSLNDTPVRVVFSHRQPHVYWHGQNIPINRPIYETRNGGERRTDPAIIYLSNYRWDPNIETHDNYAHIRTIRVTEQKVEVYRPVKK